MRFDKKIKDEKLQYNINREAAKISALSSSKIDRNEYLTGEVTLVKFIYSPFAKKEKEKNMGNNKKVKDFQKSVKYLKNSLMKGIHK